MSAGRFEGRTVLVTGGSSGIGLAAAQRFASEGARVVLVARNEQRLAAAVASLRGEGHLTRACDLTDEKAVNELFKSLKEAAGPLAAAVLGAGSHAVRPHPTWKAANAEQMFKDNVISAMNVARCFVRAARPEGASVVVLSSAVALSGGAGVGEYAAAKAALLAVTRSLALEVASRKIRVNAIAAGVVETPMSERFFATLPAPQVEAIAKSHPLGLGKPEDVAAAIAYLASDDARWVTGSTLVIDGGLTAQ